MDSSFVLPTTKAKSVCVGKAAIFHLIKDTGELDFAWTGGVINVTMQCNQIMIQPQAVWQGMGTSGVARWQAGEGRNQGRRGGSKERAENVRRRRGMATCAE